MLAPTEHKSVQARVLKYAEEIDWFVISRSVAEKSKKKALEDLFKTLLHNLMTAKIRVNHQPKTIEV